MNLFEFVTMPRIIFGNGSIQQVGSLAAEFGERVLIVSGKSQDRLMKLLEILQHQELEVFVFPVTGEPTVEDIRAGVLFAREKLCDVVLGFGGGSALDASKAIAVLYSNEGDIYDYLEVIGKGKSLSGPGLPLITVPTTAGTGAEVTRNAVIGAPDRRVKVSLRSSVMLAKIALIDPQLTHSAPPEVTARTGMDTLSQLVEPFISNQSNWMTDIFCREGMRRVKNSISKAYHSGGDLLAREDMAFASLLSGLALTNAKLGVVHGFASVIGGVYPAPHGAVCARLLPPVVTANLKALQERGEDGLTLEKFSEMARILTGDDHARPMDGVEWMERLVQVLRIPPLSSFGLREADFPQLVEKAMVASSTKGNPVVLTPDEMRNILIQAL
ncbi:MAG TPA: iron-containing alcohol dehydrogenase [Anaerolineales bacterium]|nr:iron-containing alcohol dehydrogenase [Anaerolineales bacterium]